MWIDEVVPPDVRLNRPLVFALWFWNPFLAVFSSTELPRVLKMGGQPSGGIFLRWIRIWGPFCEIFVKFGHLAISQNGSRRVSGNERALGNRVHVNVLKSRSKGWIIKHWPQFGHIDADFKNSKRDLELSLYDFTYLSRAHRIVIKCRYPESWDWVFSNGAKIVEMRCNLAG